MAKTQTWKCLECGKEFGVNEWLCIDGVSHHRVEVKQYRTLGAPTDTGHPVKGGMDSLRDGRTTVCNIPPPKKVMEGDTVRWEGEGSVEFIRGRYSTSDPEAQYWLDKRPAYNVSEEAWQAEWLSQGQQLELERMRLKGERERLENDRNELLAQTKSKVNREAVAR